jgi:hypothetical protein
MLANMTSNCRCANDLAIREQLVPASLLFRHADDGPYPGQGDDGSDERNDKDRNDTATDDAASRLNGR